MEFFLPNQSRLNLLIFIITSLTIKYTQGDSSNELSNYLTQVIERGVVAQALKQELEKENVLLSSRQDKEHIKPKRFYRWPSAATRTRVKLLNNYLNNDASNANYYRRKELEKNMVEKNRMYQYFHG